MSATTIPMSTHGGGFKKSSESKSKSPATTVSIASESAFCTAVCRERKRSERSRKHILLMLVECPVTAPVNIEGEVLPKIARALTPMIRDTDVIGWLETGKVLGVLFAELGAAEVGAARQTIEKKVKQNCEVACTREQLQKIKLSFYAFPDSWAGGGTKEKIVAPFYPDLHETVKMRGFSLALKRGLDFVASGMALLFLSPILLALAMIIKLTSKGPVLFRQERVGHHGQHFVFLKFRSMRVSTTEHEHKTYVRDFIAGKAKMHDSNGHGKGVYKLTNDSRVTRVGRIMRRTSLDELPQLWNVFVGEMSLVGPRPPIPYEIEAYDIWHRRRLLEVKPGITGLWQVKGRSKTTFDEMVRLDLQYSREWTPMLDLKILLDTPRAVFSGDGAY